MPGTGVRPRMASVILRAFLLVLTIVDDFGDMILFWRSLDRWVGDCTANPQNGDSNYIWFWELTCHMRKNVHRQGGFQQEGRKQAIHGMVG
jgi:hypothetical protein